MTQEDKQLLLQDLCARLPYGVKVKYTPENIISGIQYIVALYDEVCLEYPNNTYTVPIDDIKPYLRPVSSMTEEEKSIINEIDAEFLGEILKIQHITNDEERRFLVQKAVAKRASDTMNFYNENYIDCHGLIEKCLALESPEGMYN